MTLKATEPVTAVMNGTTFTSPTVYLSYDGVVAIDDCLRTIGKSHSGAVLNMNPTAVSSIELPHGPTRQFNFADLNTPYPPGVLLQMCFPEPPELCTIGINDTYHPLLVVPDEIRSLDPAWKSCDPDWLTGSWDPPQRLVPADALAQPTSAADIKPTSSTPTPAHTVRSQGAASTAKLDADMISSTTLTSPTKLHTCNEILTGSFPFDSPSVVILPNQSPPAVDPSDQKLSVKNTPARDLSANNSPAQNQPTKTEPIQSSPVRVSPKINPTEHYPPAQNTPSTNLLNDNPSANNSPSKSLPAHDPTTKPSPTNEPSAKKLPGNAASIENPLTNETPARLSSIDSSPLDEPMVVLPPITVKSQVFTADSASHYVINSQTLVRGGQITVSGTPISVPPLRLSAEVSLPPMPIIVIESQSVKPTPISQYTIDSQTLKRSGQITVSGTPISASTHPAAISISDPTLPPLSIASKIYSANSASQYIIASRTLTPNGRILLSETPISLLPSASAIVIGGLTNNLLPPVTSPTALPPQVLEKVYGSTTEALFPSLGLLPLTIASQTYIANQTSAYIISDQTLTLCAEITVDGTRVSLAPQASALVVGSKIETLVRSFALPTLTVGSKVYMANRASAYVINGQTLTPGGQISVDGTPVAFPTHVAALEVGSESEPFSFALPTLTIDSKLYTANQASAYIINDQTLTPGGQLSVNGTHISLAPQAAALVVGSSTELLSYSLLPTITINSKVYTINLGSMYVINDQTPTTGGQVSIDETSISLASQASALVIGSITETLFTSFALPSIIVKSESYTANSASTYVMKGQTLTASGQITVEGTPVFLAPGASALVIRSSTQILAAASSKIGLGQWIMEGFNGNSFRGSDSDGGDGSSGGIGITSAAATNVTSMTSTTASNPTQNTEDFAGGASRRWIQSRIEWAIVLSTIIFTLH